MHINLEETDGICNKTLTIFYLVYYDGSQASTISSNMLVMALIPSCDLTLGSPISSESQVVSGGIAFHSLIPFSTNARRDVRPVGLRIAPVRKRITNWRALFSGSQSWLDACLLPRLPRPRLETDLFQLKYTFGLAYDSSEYSKVGDIQVHCSHSFSIRFRLQTCFGLCQILGSRWDDIRRQI
ncbi:hypothetical protein CPB85DRAFT_479808 [Mucidula mucida]|nr:hypothetical protein CPB85DRAFT_479808 [Mucidula mucida]